MKKQPTDEQRAAAVMFYSIIGHDVFLLKLCQELPRPFWYLVWDVIGEVNRLLLLKLIDRARNSESGWSEKENIGLVSWLELPWELRELIVEVTPRMAAYCDKLLTEKN